jgi:hypothetical protein
MKKSNTWLNEFSKNVYSQNGEDGILEKIFEIVPNTDKSCVEFGAWDGKHLSNTYHLIKNQGYSAVLIEGDNSKLKKLVKNFQDNSRIKAINAFVGFSQEDNLDTLLKTTSIPQDFDLLSIDIDGNDYHVWKAMQYYTPKVVCIEYNFSIPNEVEFVQKKDMAISQGSSILSLCKLAKLKQYELIAVTQTNLIFVKNVFFKLFEIESNAINKMRLDYSSITYLFCGYDGTVFIAGNKKRVWHGVDYEVKPLPKIFRKYPGNMGKLTTLLYNGYRVWIELRRGNIKKIFSALRRRNIK